MAIVAGISAYKKNKVVRIVGALEVQASPDEESRSRRPSGQQEKRRADGGRVEDMRACGYKGKNTQYA